LVIGIFLTNEEWQHLVISWFWSNLEKSLKVMAKALCCYRELLVQCLEKWHREREKLKHLAWTTLLKTYHQHTMYSLVMGGRSITFKGMQQSINVQKPFQHSNAHRCW
jgi:hypothetical protein